MKINRALFGPWFKHVVPFLFQVPKKYTIYASRSRTTYSHFTYWSVCEVQIAIWFGPTGCSDSKRATGLLFIRPFIMRSDSNLLIFIFRSEKRMGLLMRSDLAKSDG